MSHRKEFLLVAGCGVLCAAGFGLPGGWIAVQLGLLGLFMRLVAAGDDSRRASRLLGIFVFCLSFVGQGGFGTSVAPALRPWALAITALLAAVNGLVAGATGCMAFRLRLSIALRVTVAIPALWVMREWLGSIIDAAAPWLAIGYAQAPDGPLAATLPLGGVFLASGLSVAASASLAIAWQRETLRQRLVVLAAIAVCVAAVHATGRTEWTYESAHSLAELIQGGAIPEGNFEGVPARRVLKFYADAIGNSSAALVVTPQLAIPKTPDALPDGYLTQIDARLRGRNADALLGMHFASDKRNAYFNGVEAIGASGLQRYRKHHLFPFGEYLPLGAAVSDWADTVLDHPHADAARGPVADEPMFGGGLRLAVTVCYEIGFGDTVRRQAATADAIVNLGGDASHDSLQLAGQIRQIAQTRALEFQKPLLRTSDVRGTYFIDSRGQVSGELPALEAGAVTQTVEGRSGLTPYARWGNTTVLALAGLSLAVCLLRALSTVGRHLRPVRRLHLSRQRGQVLPAAIALLVIVAGFFYLMVNAGQTVTEKIRVTDAADAAAYSAAVVEARALNYDAYLNRAMVANEMAIAQMVSFASWIDYFATAADNFGSYAALMNLFLPFDPRVAALDGAFGGSAIVAAYFESTVHEYADYLVDYGAGAIITANNAAALLLAADQIAVQGNLTAGIRQGQVADQVVKAIDPTLNAEVVLVTHGFDFFTKNYSGDDRSRLADVSVRSRDDFTRERNFTIDGPSLPLIKNNALKKRGGTELIGLDEWRGVDTLELHGQVFGCGKLGLSWCADVATPIGWGAIEVDAGDGDAGAGYHGNAYNENPTTADKADSAMREPYYAYFSGIPTSQEIADVDPANEQTTGITVLVTKSQTDTLTSGNAATVKPAGRLAVFDDHPAGGKIISLSRAQVFFDRIAARADGKSELGSLYNPYWRVRLVAPTLADRAYAATKQGGLLLPDLSAP